MKKFPVPVLSIAVCALVCCTPRPQTLTRYVNPLLGTATLHDSVDLGYVPTWRTWGAEVFPGASLPNAMVQVSPVTMFGSGAGYQYEDSLILAFSHTNKGHWNLNHVPIVASTGEVTPEDYASPFSHEREEAAPGYYRVFLERGAIDAEVTSTLRAAFHRYTFTRGGERRVLVDLQRANDRIREWDIRQEGPNAFSGWQQGGDRVHFWAETNGKIKELRRMTGEGDRVLPVVDFEEGRGPLELKIGFSFVSVENARANLEAEMLDKSFRQVRREATDTWQALLGKIRVTGGTERQRGLFYSTLYRSMLWPALRSDVNGDFAVTRRGEPGPDGRPTFERRTDNRGFRLYTDPSFWDDYRNKLVLLGLLAPDVTVDVINSITYRGEQTGYMPTFFHGDHASAFVAGTYLRGLTDGYDVERAYRLLMNNATIPGRGGRPWLAEYIERGWISEEVQDPPFVVADERKAAVTKTQEYAYDDYATAQLAKALGHTADHDMLMARTGNYKNLFNPANGFMQGRFEDGSWLTPFDPYFPYYAYMYREANGWQSIFYAPHDPEGMLALYPSPEAAEAKLDSLFSEPWRGIQAHTMSVFIGQYCHGNQPDHGFPYMYYFLDRQEKGQKILSHILENFYDMGPHGLAYAGMDDAGEMSAWYVFNALGLYTFSPADPEYLVTVPLFDRVEFDLPEGTFTIRREGEGPRISSITYNGEPVAGYKITHDALKLGGELVISAQ
jgi:predicted alpha-1,2-mannosidase